VSHWETLAALPLEVEGYTLDVLKGEHTFRGGMESATVLVTLHGGGLSGAGEEPGAMPEHRDVYVNAGPYLELAGSWTLGSFCVHLATLDQWRAAPAPWEMMERWRNWSFESAALDLALQQAEMSLAGALGLQPRPLTFVNSLGLGDPPSADTILRRIELYPTVGFKLDAEAGWTSEIVDVLAGTGMVRTIDFKGRYGLEVPSLDALRAMYELVLAAFPEAIFEDPHEELESLIPASRLSFDAPVARVADVRTSIVNIKPMRVGSLEPLFSLYEHCAANGIAMYGGGMGERGIARGQIELLAMLFHPDTPNDVAPTPFNDPEPPPGLPQSPLVPGTPPAGFRLTAQP
jgi:hypothetical protein